MEEHHQAFQRAIDGGNHRLGTKAHSAAAAIRAGHAQKPVALLLVGAQGERERMILGFAERTILVDGMGSGLDRVSTDDVGGLEAEDRLCAGLALITEPSLP
jgi:hypothetical protein